MVAADDTTHDASRLLQEMLAAHSRLEEEQGRLRAMIEALQPKATVRYGPQAAAGDGGPAAHWQAPAARRLLDEDEIAAVEGMIRGLPDGPVKVALQHLATATAHIRTCLDYMWLLLCGALVTFMQAGFAMLEAGTCRSRSAGITLLKNVMDACVGAVLWYAVGYAFAYGVPDGPNEFIGADLFFGTSFDAEDSRHHLDWFFQWAFCATSATIVSGAVAERIQFSGYLMIASVMTAFIYPVVVWWTWSGHGFLSELGYSDFAGSGTVHLTGGSAAFAAAAVLGPRLGRFRGDSTESPFVPNNLPMVVLGTLILWMGWYGFNCGSTLSFSSVETARQASLVAVNTTLSASLGGLTALTVRVAQTGKLDLQSCCNGILAGLVAVCAGCADMNPLAAIFCGMCGCLSMMVTSRVVAFARVDDPLDATAVHAGGGVVGLLLRPLLDRSGVQGEMLATHLLAIVCIVAWSATLSTFTLLVIKRLGYLSVTQEEEELGLDAAALVVSNQAQHDSAEFHPVLGGLEPGQVAIGVHVAVNESFMSNNKSTKVMIRKGMSGIIKQVDTDGDVRVEFDKLDGLHWVLRRNFDKLRAISADSANFPRRRSLGSASEASSRLANFASSEPSGSSMPSTSEGSKGQAPPKQTLKKKTSTVALGEASSEAVATDRKGERPAKPRKQPSPPAPPEFEGQVSLDSRALGA
jgi:Amt family ammonium transporter